MATLTHTKEGLSSEDWARRVLGKPTRRKANGDMDSSGGTIPSILDLEQINIPKKLAMVNPRLVKVPIKVYYAPIREVNYFTQAEIEDLYQRTLRAQEQFKIARDATSNKKMRSIPNSRVADIIKENFTADEKTSPHLQHPLVQIMVQNYSRQTDADKEEGKSNFDSTVVRAADDAYKSNIALGFRQLSYNKFIKEPTLQFIAFDRVDFPELQAEYPSHASAVNLIKSTDAYANPFIDVASFPESHAMDSRNKVHKNDPDSQARYHIDKFLARIYAYTNFALNYNTDTSAFKLMKSASYEQLFKAAASWLSVHESYHSKGPIPRVKRWLLDTPSPQEEINSWYGYDMKDSKKGGIWEELRVDINGMLEADSIAAAKGYRDLGPLVREVILAERLLRYPIQRDPDDDFDACTSTILINWLLENGAVIITGDRISINHEKLPDALRSLRDEMDKIEREITEGKNLSEQKDYEAGVKAICDFVDQWVCKHNIDGSKDYKLHPFHKTMRDTREDPKKRQEYLNALWLQELIEKNWWFGSKQRPWYYEKAKEAFELDDQAKKTPKAPKKTNTNKTEEKEEKPDPKPVYWIYDPGEDLQKDYSDLLTKKEYLSRAELDELFFKQLASDARLHSKSSNLSPKTFLMDLAVGLISGKEVPKELLYYAYKFDINNRFDSIQLANYKKAIEKFYAKPLSLIDNVEGKEDFIAQLRRVIRAHIRRRLEENVVNHDKYRKIIEGMRITRRDIVTGGIVGLLALSVAIPITAVSVNYLNDDGLEEIFITHSEATLRPTPITEITNPQSEKRLLIYNGKNPKYKIDGNSITMFARILPILRKMIPANIASNNITFSAPGDKVKLDSILIVGKGNTRHIVFSKTVLKKLFEQNIPSDKLEDFLKSITKTIE